MQMMISKRVSVTPRLLAGFAEGALALAILIYMGYHLAILFSPPFLELTYPDRDMTTADATLPVAGSTEKESHVFINGIEIAVAQGGAFSDSFVLQNGMNAIEIKSVNRFGRTTAIIRRINKQGN